MKRLVIDDAIPFLEGRLENYFECVRLPGAKISHNDLLDADGLLVRTRTRCDAPLLEDTPVSFVATATIGIDHIDTKFCDSHGIDWQNAPGCNAPAVAQYVWRALFELGFDPASMTLGVVGKGNVGSIVTEWGRRLGAKVLVSDPPRTAVGLTDEHYIPLEELMQSADAVTFHTPLIKKSTPELDSTIHLASARTLPLLKTGGILINAARGGIVDEQTLLDLKKEKGWKTILDTWENEPEINKALLSASDISTFHIAGYSLEGKQRASYAVLEGLERHFGISLDKSGLAGPYTPPRALGEKELRGNYDILADDAVMRREYRLPADFERLRNTYPMRPELL